MFINKILFDIFAIICFCYLVHADESAECDCDILQIYSEDDPNKYYNFTKQWDKEVEEWFFFSIEHHLRWWNNDSNKHQSQHYHRNPVSCQNISQKLSLKFPWPANESKVLESQCLQDNKCLASKENVTGKKCINYFSHS